MKTNEEWPLFERLADPALLDGERRRLEDLIAADPGSQRRYEAFRLLREWPTLDQMPDSSAARGRLFEKVSAQRESDVTDRELGRLFPVFFGGAVAAALVLAAVNFWHFESLAGGTLEALFGLPDATMESAIVSQL